MLQLALALAALCFCPPSEEVFRSITFEQAQSAAQQEKKVILIDFFTTWCEPCKKLDATTWKDDAVLQWIGKQCVALKLDAEKNKDLAKRFHIDAYPTVLLLKADGSLIARLVGYKDAKEFLSAADDALAGKDPLAHAKEKLVGHERDPMARQSYADELVEAGKYEEALAEYLWCFDEGKSSPGYSGVRISFLLSDIERLGRSYPPAIKALEERRDATEARLRKGPIGDDDLTEAVALNKSLKTPEKSLALLGDLKKVGPLPPQSRLFVMYVLMEPLHEGKRYTDLLELLDDPVKYVTASIEQYESERKLSKGTGAEDKKSSATASDFMKSITVSHGSIIFESLIATGRAAEADKVSEALIAFDATGKTYAALIAAADRAGAAERVKALGERGLASLPEKEQAPVKRAVARAGKAK